MAPPPMIRSNPERRHAESVCIVRFTFQSMASTGSRSRRRPFERRSADAGGDRAPPSAGFRGRSIARCSRRTVWASVPGRVQRSRPRSRWRAPRRPGAIRPSTTTSRFDQRPSSKKRTSQTEVYGQSTSTSPEAGGGKPGKTPNHRLNEPSSLSSSPRTGQNLRASRRQPRANCSSDQCGSGCGNNGCGLRERGTDGDVESGVPRRVRRRDARRRDRPRFEPTPRCPGTGQRRHVRQRHRANRVRQLRHLSPTRRLSTIQPPLVRGPQRPGRAHRCRRW